jgi:hypothetical protein
MKNKGEIMKKIFSALFAILVLVNFSHSQELGVRFGDIVGNNVAIDAVFNNIHADLSFGNGGLGAEALFDFLHKPLKGEAFGLYAGAGAFAWIGDPFSLGISGELGLDYHFRNLPLSLSFDWRPSFVIIESTSFAVDRFGFNIRFVF